MTKTRNAVELLSTERFVDLGANLRISAIDAILAGCRERGRGLAASAGRRNRRIERLHCEYIEAQRAEVETMLKRLAGP